MKIVLMRHGRPVLPSPRYVTPVELPAWVVAYDAANLDPTVPPPAAAVESARDCRLVVCSHLTRSHASALALGRTPHVVDAAFQEFRLAYAQPYAQWLGPRLPAPVWLVFFRVLALFRGTPDADRARAEHAARKLIDLASAGGPLLFIGHGLFNRAAARQLRAQGWRGPARPSLQHWGFSTYTAPPNA